jgi:hypothetical protein
MCRNLSQILAANSIMPSGKIDTDDAQKPA